MIATLKHFVGYSASRAGRNLAPVHAGPRELADVLLLPFEMAVLDGGARSVMHSYAEVDGLPIAADAGLLTGLLRERWGFEGTVVADYFGVAFLSSQHAVADDLGAAAVQALSAGVDIELPTGNAYLEPLVAKVLAGAVAVVQAFFPGEEGAAAIAGVLSGRVNPSGRLPVSLPRSAGAQPYSYLHPALGGTSDASTLATPPALPFGHGLSCTTFTHTDLVVEGPSGGPVVRTGGTVDVRVRTTNTGGRRGVDVVQLYGPDVVGSVTRPTAQLIGYRRVELDPGETADVTFSVPTTRLALSDRSMVRVVEPGAVELWVGASCDDRETSATLEVAGPVRPVTMQDERWVTVTVVRSRRWRATTEAPGRRGRGARIAGTAPRDREGLVDRRIAPS